MNLRCRIFRETGFNASNIPDKPTLIIEIGQESYGSGTKMIELDPLDIVQDRFLSVIQVKATWKQIRTADYVQLYEPGGSGDNSWWYAIDDIQMMAEDVAQLTLLEDFVTSVGGIEEVSFLDGETERVHVSDDPFGKYTEDDPLCAPAMPLTVSSSAVGLGGNFEDCYVFVETTVDLVKQAANSNGGDASVFVDPADSNNKTLVPKIFASKNKTIFILPEIQHNGTAAGEIQRDRETVLYVLNDTTTISENEVISDDALANVPYTYGDTISIGINEVWNNNKSDTGIISMYRIPKSLVTITTETDHYTGNLPSMGPLSQSIHFYGKRVTTIKYGSETGSLFDSAMQTLPFEYANVSNKRVLYGKFNKYGIMTTAGNKMEIEPESILPGSSGTLGTCPVISHFGDTRPDGKPYFYFRDLYRVSTAYVPSYSAYTMIAGSTWEKVPFRFDTSRGNKLDVLSYSASAELSNYNFATQQEGRYYGPTAGLNKFSDDVYKFTSATQALSGYGETKGMGTIGGALAITATAATELANRTVGSAGWKNAREREAYAMSRRNELLNLSIPMATKVPNIEGMPNSETVRDVLGNVCLAYRFRLQQSDIDRIDRLLTMYGYKYTKALAKADFTNRKYFNFVKCNDVSVTGHSRIVNEGIAGQLKAGVRIWHVKPSRTHYTDNPVA